MMEGMVEIKQITKDVIEVMGTTYYSETYLKAMMDREYSRGKRDIITIHVAQVVSTPQ